MFPDLTRDDVFRLETPRLWLRWPRASDAAAIARILSQDEEGAVATRLARAAEGPEAYILAARAANAQGRAVELALTMKSTQEPVGRVGARFADGEVEVSCLVDPARRDQGYAGEAVAAVVDIVFALTYAPRLWARAAAQDAASIATLERQGFTRTHAAGRPNGAARIVLERAAREWVRARRVPAMTQQGALRRGAGAPPPPEAALAAM